MLIRTSVIWSQSGVLVKYGLSVAPPYAVLFIAVAPPYSVLFITVAPPYSVLFITVAPPYSVLFITVALPYSILFIIVAPPYSVLFISNFTVLIVLLHVHYVQWTSFTIDCWISIRTSNSLYNDHMPVFRFCRGSSWCANYEIQYVLRKKCNHIYYMMWISGDKLATLIHVGVL